MVALQLILALWAHLAMPEMGTPPPQRLLHRWYSPTTGRFISRDPIGFDGGQINLYQYVGNRPIENRDPQGLIFVVEGSLYKITEALAARQLHLMQNLIYHWEGLLAGINAECGALASTTPAAEWAAAIKRTRPMVAVLQAQLAEVRAALALAEAQASREAILVWHRMVAEDTNNLLWRK